MHWKNSNFGIRYFLANGCHTPDEAYRILKQLHEERDVAIRNSEASELRTKAKILRANQILADSSSTEIERLEAQADISEVEAFREQSTAVLEQAIRERSYIESLIDELQPHRKYKDLPDHEAFQMTQTEEWKLELIWRAENFLASQGSIPHDHLSTMRLHPDWETELFPQIQHIISEQHQNNLTLKGHDVLAALPSIQDEQS